MSSQTKHASQPPLHAERLTPKSYFFKVLNGVALGIIVALLPNAILGELMKLLSPHSEFFQALANILIAAQFTTPILVGALIGINFNLKPLEVLTVAMVAFIGAGNAQFTESGWTIVGIGNLVNTMIAAALAVGIILCIHNRLGSLNIVFLPLITLIIAGTISVYIFPYVQYVSLGIGGLINEFTTYQPLLMTIFIAVSFSLIIVSPVSTIGIAVAVGIDGMAAGATNVGVAAAATSLALGAYRANKFGIPLAIVLGATKMMLPNVVRNPLILIPVVSAAATAGLTASFFGLLATTTTAGLGYIGLAGPVTALSLSNDPIFFTLIGIILTYIVVPVITALVVDFLCRHVFQVYDIDIYHFKANAT